MSDQLTEARRLLAEAIFVEPQDVASDAAIGADERWDSLAHARLMLALEAKLGRTLEPDEIAAVDSVPAIATLLRG